MYGGLKGRTDFALVLAVFGLSGTASAPALAADLGGDCCADLEERIAELEATTARKGNRKVSLTVSGWVNEAVFFWDDGHESNVYVGTNCSSRIVSASSAMPRSPTAGRPATSSRSA